MDLAKIGGWTIFKKLLIFSIVLVVLPLGIFGGFGLVSFSNAIEDQVEVDLLNSVQGKIDVLRQAMIGAKRESNIIADHEAANVLLYQLYHQSNESKTEKIEEIQSYLGELRKESMGLYENLFFIDTKGTIVADGKEGESLGLDVSGMNFYQGVKETGKQYLGDVMESPVSGRPVVVLATPVLEGSAIVGYFCASMEFNKLTEMLIKRADGVKYNYGIFNKDGVTIAHEDKEQIFNLDFKKHTGGLNVVYQRAIQGESGFETYTLDGARKILAFEPFGEKNWTVYAASKISDYMTPVQKMNQAMLIVGGICLIAAIATGFIFSRSLAKPLQKITEVIGQVSEGDLTVHVSEIKLKDEIGQLNQYFKTMLVNLRGVITNVVDEAQITNDSSLKAREAFQELQGAVENISATIEEISAGMEESASATQEVAASSQSINSSIDGMAIKAQTGAKQANEMLVRAKELLSKSNLSKANTAKILRENQSKLQKAVQDAEVVKEIERLTTSILGITKQTNLLALNAAIEAARAGEAGKGFAVVADEIRQLAEESAGAAGDIQNVTKQVTSSVQNLIQSSNKLLEFIDHEVAQDYDVMSQTAEQYDEDAQMVATTMEEFSTTSERLAEMVGQVARAINEISGVINEGADGANAISSNIMTVVEKADEVEQLSADSKDSAQRLEGLVGKFKI